MNKTIRISESTLSLLQILKSEYEKNNPELQVEVTHDYMINELIQVYSNRHTVSIDNQDLINHIIMGNFYLQLWVILFIFRFKNLK